MRKGDTLFSAILLGSLVLIVVDGSTGGAVATWLNANLYPQALKLGTILGWVARWTWPLLALPLVFGLAGRFVRLPARLNLAQHRLVELIESLTLQIGGAARWFALGLVLVTVTIVIQRYVFGYASTKLQESVIYMHALLFLLASASTLLADGHVRVDIFYAKASERGKAWTELIGIYLALMPMCVLILWTSTGYIDSSWRILEQSRESDGLPLVFLLKTAIPAFAVLMIAQGFAGAIRAALIISGETAPPRPITEIEAEI
jgi:TRAP-type mannitol/chloroaromatic compound transport system permease small subunit